LSELLTIDSLTKVIIITGQSEKENALQAVGQGAYDFLCKPVDMEPLKFILRRAFHVAQLERDYREMQRRAGVMCLRDAGSEHPDAGGLRLDSEGGFDGCAGADFGESGTGKEMVALAIHRQSSRRRAFCRHQLRAIPESLLESELFGHEKGAFTGAHAQRKGRIESGAGGTALSGRDRELTPALQVKLLRFLQDQRFERVGGRTSIRIDTRVMAATKQRPQESDGERAFREDLYFRLAVVVVRLPPLRERPEDIPLLAKAFLNKFAAENGRKTPVLTAQAMRALQNHDWPGNVRELENRLRRAVIMLDGSQIMPADLELSGLSSAVAGRTLKKRGIARTGDDRMRVAAARRQDQPGGR